MQPSPPRPLPLLSQAELDDLQSLRNVDRTTPGAAHGAAFRALAAMPRLLDEVQQLRGFMRQYTLSFACPKDTPTWGLSWPAADASQEAAK